MTSKRSSAKKPVNAASLLPVPVGDGLVAYEGAFGQFPVTVAEG